MEILIIIGVFITVVAIGLLIRKKSKNKQESVAQDNIPQDGIGGGTKPEKLTNNQ